MVISRMVTPKDMRPKSRLLEELSMPQPPMELQIRDEEWDFREIPRDRLGEALVYEYCRSQKSIVDVVKNCAEDVGDSAKYGVPSVPVYAVKRKVNVTI